MNILKYKKRPVVIEAAQYDGTEKCAGELAEWGKGPDGKTTILPLYDVWDGGEKFDRLEILTLEGTHLVSPGDFVVKGVKGEFYPVKPDIFILTYESAGEEK
jgi:hypothetical protein